MSFPLPPDWTARQLPDGRFQYTNESTGESQWQSPASSAKRAPLLAPSSTPAWRSQFTLDRAVDYVIKEHHRCSGEIYSVRQMDTNEVQFLVRGRKSIRAALAKAGVQFDHRNPRELCDPQQQLLYRRRQDFGTAVQLLEGATGNTVITFRRKGFFPGFGISTILAWWGDRAGNHHMEVQGKMMRCDYRFEIKDVVTERIIAAVRRKGIDGKRDVKDWTSFVLHVEPGENTALIALFSIALFEEFRGDA